jgi:hypothetical protein
MSTTATWAAAVALLFTCSAATAASRATALIRMTCTLFEGRPTCVAGACCKGHRSVLVRILMLSTLRLTISVGKPCAPAVLPPRNGTLGTCANETAHESTCSFACKQGFRLFGNPGSCYFGELTGQTQTCRGACLVLCRFQDTAFMHLLCFVFSDTCFAFGGLAPLPAHALPGDCNDTVIFNKHCSMRCKAGYKLEGKQFSCSQDTGLFQADPHDPQTCTGLTCIACARGRACHSCGYFCRDPCGHVPQTHCD